jgi:hypothetical protein
MTNTKEEATHAMNIASIFRSITSGAFGVCLVLAPLGARAQQPIDQQELAAYRLTDPVLQRFAHAARLVASAARSDPRLAQTPLFTKEIAITGDVREMAAELQTRLDSEPAYRTALFAAEIDAREFTTFALALFAARLAQGFIDAKLIYVMPDTVAGQNVAFVQARQTEIRTLFADLGVE